MPKPRVSAGGGLAAIRYSLLKGREAGGLWKFYNRMRSRNACKTCAFGMGGQRGGMVNEHGRFPAVRRLPDRVRISPGQKIPRPAAGVSRMRAQPAIHR